MPRLGSDDDQMRALKARIDAAANQATRAMSVASSAATTPAKRFRIGVFVTPLTVLGGQVQGAVKWSTPITDGLGQQVDDYNVDAACSAFSTPMSATYSAQTSGGVTVTFTAPILLAAGSIVIVQAIGPAVATPAQLSKQ